MNVLLLLCLFLLFVFIIGAVIGSFLNVVALRGLTGESIVLPPSKCPKCGNKLKPWHNIPILSYLFLRGKCAFCAEKISIQYPIVEFLTGAFAVAVILKFAPTFTALFFFIAICSLIVMSVTDIKEQVIRNWHVLFFIATGLAYNLLRTNYVIQTQTATGTFALNAQNILTLPITEAVIGLVAGAVVMEIMAAVGFIFAKQRAFGVGDTFILAGIGALLGWKPLLLVVALSVAVQVGIVTPSIFKKFVVQKDYTTIISLVSFVVMVALFLLANVNGLLENFFVCIIASLILAGAGIFACFRVLKGMKMEGGITVFPFGPALAIATIIVIFTIIR